MANTYLKKTGISGGNQKKWTFSGWFKKSTNGSELRLITSSDNSSYDDNIRFNSDDTITIGYRNAVVIKTNRKFRDNNGYYHIVVKVDTDQSTVNNRIILYVNGIDERVNGYSTDDLPGQGLTGYINYAQHYIGITNPSANSNHFNGIMSHVHFTDGYAYTASSFGETDSTTGEWKINVAPSVTYGSTGFWLFKNDNAVTDRSGQGNNFTSVGAGVTKTEDCPSNVFATMNVLANFGTQWALFENGNTYVRSAGSGEAFIASNLGIPATSGKFYAEVKYTQGGSYAQIGITGKAMPTASGEYLGKLSDSYCYLQSNGHKQTNDGSSSYGNSYAVGDIIGIAVDATNSKIYFSKNGVWQNSGDPTSGATGTGAAFTISTTPTDGFYFMGCDKQSGSTKNYFAWNFGNGFFGTTAVSSAGTNASGIGIFEYDVPTGYTALSTKGLNL